MKSQRTGFARLPLHGGKAPPWLFSRMARLARGIILHLVEEFGPSEILRRLSDPFWFQALGCVLGFDWHSSGVTTTTCGAIKEGIKGLEKEIGFYAAGGKGRVSRRTPQEITATCEKLSNEPQSLVYASRMAAKVDNAALQDEYQLYHHCFFFTSTGEWCVVQQGMRSRDHTARRYHWLSANVHSFVQEPHSAVCCDVNHPVLNLVAKESQAVRIHSVELVLSPQKEVLKIIDQLPTLELPHSHLIKPSDINPQYMHKILRQTYQEAPATFQDLLAIRGVGPKSLRALALVSEIIYGTPASFKDPARFSFAHGGKDGTPYPVDRETYDQTIHILQEALAHTKVDRSEKIKAFKRLTKFARVDKTHNKV